MPRRDPLSRLSMAEIERRLRTLDAIHPGQRTLRARRERMRLAEARTARRRTGRQGA